MLRLLNFPLIVIFTGFYLLQTSKSTIGFTGFAYQCHYALEKTKVTTSLMTYTL